MSTWQRVCMTCAAPLVSSFPPLSLPSSSLQAVILSSPARLLAFCQAVQRRCPVGAYIKPTAGVTAGYESEVVFADGTFIDGSTIELSCDGPLRPPFAVFCQVWEVVCTCVSMP
ncbi:unnamed protein product [Closterium sp. NIES-54]